jgi:crotonobetainyl-CoA:carnitine CoA-transferase CaiB-like acyl-CoA transferase
MRRIQTLIDAPDGATVLQPMAEPRVDSILATMLPYRTTLALESPRPAPHLGEHTHEALREWLDLPDHEIDELVEQGVLA